MGHEPIEFVDSSALRVALWRALHAQIDDPPCVLDDQVGLLLAEPGDDWRTRGDMDPAATRRPRASIVARARFVEDLVKAGAAAGIDQYLILGAGLDTFAQRHPELATRLRIFEVDRPGPQAWKRRRLAEAGFEIPESLRLVPVDFEAGTSWPQRLTAAGFDWAKPAIAAWLGVTVYLTRNAIEDTMRCLAKLPNGSPVVMTFMLPADLVEPAERTAHRMSADFGQNAGTPFVSYLTPQEAVELARIAGFADATYLSAADLAERYFTGKPPEAQPSSLEGLLVASTAAASQA